MILLNLRLSGFSGERMLLPRYTIRKVVKRKDDVFNSYLGEFDYSFMDADEVVISYYSFQSLLKYLKEQKLNLSEVINVKNIISGRI